MNSDLIRREDAVEALYQALRTTLAGTVTDSMSLAIAMANNLPSAEPDEHCGCCEDVHDDLKYCPNAEQERKKGQWIDEKINSYTSRTYCSECGSSAPFVYKSDDYYGNHAHGETAKTKFCPNCGADMRGEGDFIIECETYDSDEC